MTNRERLALHIDLDPSHAQETMGDESGAGDGTDPMLMLRMEVEIRFRRIEKQLKVLHEIPEIAAMKARMENRRTYG